MQQAELVHGIYRQTYERVPSFWRSQIDLAKRQGYVETISGRRVKIIGDWGGSFGWSMGSTAINYAIQGTGADQKYLALAVLKPHMRKYDVKFVLDMHDGLYFFVPDTHVFTVAALFRDLLNNLPYQEAWGMTPSIPMPWDCKFGPSWGNMMEWKDDVA
jgi:DNA polymerase-1